MNCSMRKRAHIHEIEENMHKFEWADVSDKLVRFNNKLYLNEVKFV